MSEYVRLLSQHVGRLVQPTALDRSCQRQGCHVPSHHSGSHGGTAAGDVGRGTLLRLRLVLRSGEQEAGLRGELKLLSCDQGKAAVCAGTRGRGQRMQRPGGREELGEDSLIGSGWHEGLRGTPPLRHRPKWPVLSAAAVASSHPPGPHPPGPHPPGLIPLGLIPLGLIPLASPALLTGQPGARQIVTPAGANPRQGSRVLCGLPTLSRPVATASLHRFLCSPR